MKRRERLVMLSLLTVSITMVINSGSAYGKGPMIIMPTDNGTTNVEITIESGTVNNNQFTIDKPQLVTFGARFVDSTTLQLIEHVNYKFTITDANGNRMYEVREGHAHTGVNSYSLLFPNTGSYTLTIDVEGTGAMRPYDSTYTGTATSSVTVTPEFPLSVIAVMAAVVSIGVATTRFRNPLKF